MNVPATVVGTHERNCNSSYALCSLLCQLELEELLQQHCELIQARPELKYIYSKLGWTTWQISIWFLVQLA